MPERAPSRLFIARVGCTLADFFSFPPSTSYGQAGTETSVISSTFSVPLIQAMRSGVVKCGPRLLPLVRLARKIVGGGAVGRRRGTGDDGAYAYAGRKAHACTEERPGLVGTSNRRTPRWIFRRAPVSAGPCRVSFGSSCFRVRPSGAHIPQIALQSQMKILPIQ